MSDGSGRRARPSRSLGLESEKSSKRRSHRAKARTTPSLAPGKTRGRGPESLLEPLEPSSVGNPGLRTVHIAPLFRRGWLSGMLSSPSCQRDYRFADTRRCTLCRTQMRHAKRSAARARARARRRLVRTVPRAAPRTAAHRPRIRARTAALAASARRASWRAGTAVVHRRPAGASRTRRHASVSFVGGFGFIRADEGGDDLFCHCSQIRDGTPAAFESTQLTPEVVVF